LIELHSVPASQCPIEGYRIGQDQSGDIWQGTAGRLGPDPATPAVCLGEGIRCSLIASSRRLAASGNPWALN